jgi:hypothetical protein
VSSPLSETHSRNKRGISLGAFVGILLGCGVLLFGAGLVVMTVLFVRERHQRLEREAELATLHEAAASSAEVDAHHRSPHPDLPTVQRHVPNHPLRLLEGCSPENLATITDLLGDAIQEGAPLYNHGNFAGCYTRYVAAALEVEREMPKTCAGPRQALAAGRTTAKTLDLVSEQAWAMRDAFDGLLEVVARSQESGGGSSL